MRDASEVARDQTIGQARGWRPGVAAVTWRRLRRSGGQGNSSERLMWSMRAVTADEEEHRGPSGAGEDRGRQECVCVCGTVCLAGGEVGRTAVLCVRSRWIGHLWHTSRLS